MTRGAEQKPRGPVHISLLLFGAVRSDLQLAVSLASVRQNLLAPLTHGHSLYKVSIHGSMDCSHPCTLAAVRSAFAGPKLRADTLVVEGGVNSTDSMLRYRRAMAHAARAAAVALRAGAKLAIAARVDVEYASPIHRDLVPPGATLTWQVSQNASASGERRGGGPAWIVVPDFAHFHQLNDRFVYGPMGTVLALFEWRLHNMAADLFAEHLACLAARTLKVAVLASPIRLVRRRSDLSVPDADRILAWRSMPQRSWMRAAESGSFCRRETKVRFWGGDATSCQPSDLTCKLPTRFARPQSHSISLRSSGKAATNDSHNRQGPSAHRSSVRHTPFG